MPPTRRTFLQTTAAALIGDHTMAAPLALNANSIVEAGVLDLQAAMAAGDITSRGLVRSYVARIESFDRPDEYVRGLLGNFRFARRILASIV